MNHIRIDAHYAIYLLIAVGWTTLFSMTIRYPIRGLRNFGLLASYVLLLVMLFRVNFVSAVTTWCAFGIAGGCLYGAYELLTRARAKGADKEANVPLARLLMHSLMAWPLMIPEAIEYLLAELGVLRTAKLAPPQNETEPPSAGSEA